MADRRHETSDAAVDLEAMVRRAADYVQPTDDLRPRTLEAACDRGSRRRGRRLAFLVATVLVIAPAFGSLVVEAGWTGASGVTAAELHQRADQLVVQRQTKAAWSLFEAFSGLRREQARQLRPDRAE